MAINLLEIQPHKVSRDLSGYITYIYGGAGIGKTTFGSRMPKPLLIAAEKGYSTIPNVMVQDVTSWGEMRQILRELKKPEVKEHFQTIVLDTIDILSEHCQKYICNQLGIENIGDGGWTNNGWARYKKEFEEVFRTLAQMGYAIVFISHAKEKTIKPKYGEEYQQICPTLQSSAEAIVENMVDLMGYAHTIVEGDTSRRVLTFRSSDDSVVCKSRFSQIIPEIDFTCDALQKALIDAIEKEAVAYDNKFVTDAPAEPIKVKTYDFNKLKKDFQSIVEELMAQSNSNAAKITSIVDKYLGKGKKVTDCTPEQCEQIDLIIDELKEIK